MTLRSTAAFGVARAIAVAIACSLVAATAEAQWPPANNAQPNNAQQPPTGGNNTPQPPAAQGNAAVEAPPNPLPWGKMQAGGLTPPPPMPAIAPDPGIERTLAALELAKKKDSGRRLTWFWLVADGGYEHTALAAIDDKKLTQGFVPRSADGGWAGGALGARLWIFTLGARGKASFSAPYKRWSAGGELGFHFPLGIVEPYLDLGGGYTALFDLGKTPSEAAAEIKLRGFYVRVGSGLDVFVTKNLAIGIGATWELLGWSRPALSAAAITRINASTSLTADQRAAIPGLATDGTGRGFTAAVDGRIGLHF